jgi:hypothetical protein
MVEIAQAESNCRPEATNKSDIETSIGPLQLNVKAHPDISVRCARSYDCTAVAALVIYQRRGLEAWSVYRNGTVTPYRRVP